MTDGVGAAAVLDDLIGDWSRDVASAFSGTRVEMVATPGTDMFLANGCCQARRKGRSLDHILIRAPGYGGPRR